MSPFHRVIPLLADPPARLLLRPLRLIAAIVVLVAPPAFAAEVSDAWARSTVNGQTASVAYMTITSATAARLVGASSAAAAVVQVHEMSLQGTTMKMRPVEALDLPAGKAVELKPRGIHVMLMDLRQPLVKGDRLQLILRIEGADRKVVEQAVSIEVRDAPPMMKAP